MKTKVCFIYPWATLGGVERVLLNRAKAFAFSKTNIEMSVYFLHDSGGLKAFQHALEKDGLMDTCKVVTEINDNYDFIIPIDTEDGVHIALKSNGRIIFECHTSYKENRKYLRDIHNRCEAIIVPSEEFRDEISQEINNINTQCYVLENFVPWDIHNDKHCPPISLPDWVGIPVLYLGRMDPLKNYAEFISAMSLAQQRFPGKFFPIFCGPTPSSLDLIQELKNSGLFGKSLYLPAIPFESVKPLIKALVLKNGIFVSPSKAESFGLSAAEALSYGMPTLLSNIPSHLRLIEPHDTVFSYPLGNPVGLVDQLNWIANHYDTAVLYTKDLRSRLSSDRFIMEWEKLMVGLDKK